jgi:hypothetical protein
MFYKVLYVYIALMQYGSVIVSIRVQICLYKFFAKLKFLLGFATCLGLCTVELLLFCNVGHLVIFIMVGPIFIGLLLVKYSFLFLLKLR